MEWIKMEKHIDECAKVFLRDQKQLFDEPVAYDLEEAKEFLEDCMAVYCKNIKELRRQLYHAITPNDYKIRVFKDVMMRGMSNDLTVEESKIWTKEEDYEFVKIKVRRAIKAMVNNADLPKLKVANSEKYAIKAVYIASFMIWCHVGRAHYKDFIDYLTNQLKDALLQMPKYKSIMSALNNQQAKITSYFDDFEAFANT